MEELISSIVLTGVKTLCSVVNLLSNNHNTNKNKHKNNNNKSGTEQAKQVIININL